MADTVSKERRSQIMSNIKGKNTKPEMLVRKGLYTKGYRYRLHRKDLPGCPDLVLPKYRAVVFVNGCFWHLHGCHLSTIPKTRTEFWEDKLKKNRARDMENVTGLLSAGWRVAVVWECSLRGKSSEEQSDVIDRLAGWFSSDERIFSIP